MASWHGIARLAWPFDSPNQLGAVLVIALPVLVAYAVAGSRRVPRLLSGAAAVAVAACLGATYSRGGWAGALAAGLLLIAWFRGADRRRAAFALAALVAVFVALPAGSSRMASGFQPQAYGSVGNRVDLWLAATACARDNPWSGVGLERLSGELLTWYQPLGNTFPYSGAVSTPLTVGAGAGLLAMAALVAAWLGVQLAWVRSGVSWWLAFGLGAGQVGFGVACCASDHHQCPAVWVPAVSLACFQAAWLLRSPFDWKPWTFAAACGLAAACSVFAVGCANSVMERGRVSAGGATWALPRRPSPGPVVVLLTTGADHGQGTPAIIRRLAASGLPVVTADPSGPFEAAEKAPRLVDEAHRLAPGRECALVGIGQAAQAAIQASVTMENPIVIGLDPVLDVPLPGLNPWAVNWPSGCRVGLLYTDLVPSIASRWAESRRPVRVDALTGLRLEEMVRRVAAR
jgi:hypothetical protein